MRISKGLAVSFGVVLFVWTSASAATISVNFHVEGDADAQADHELSGSEAAGLDGNRFWNNIGVGSAGTSSGAIFPSTTLSDDSGDLAAATISPSVSSSRFVGYAASAATVAQELVLAGDDDNLFNSYLAMGSADAAVLNITDLGSAYTEGGYHLIIYSDTDRRGTSSSARQSRFTVTPAGGSSIIGFTEDDDKTSDKTYNTFANSYVESDNSDTGADYSNTVVFSNLTAASFSLDISSPDGGRGGMSGFQIVTSNDPLPDPEPVINHFSADTLRVSTNGTPVTLSWEVSDADVLTILPDLGTVIPITVDGVGQTSIVINANATYTLTASNAMGSVSADLVFHLPLDKPNILLILVDDFGPMDTSVPFAYDHYDDSGLPLVTAFNTFYHTPNMETLAERGMKFTQAYAQPVCSPSRTSLMTGYNSPRHGVGVHLNVNRTIDNYAFDVTSERGPNNWRYQGMETTDGTLPKLLGAAGYRTIHCGKAHIGSDVIGTGDPTGIGFDINIAGSEIGAPSSYTGSYGGNLPGMEDYENSGMFLTDALTHALNEHMTQSVADGVPFFGYMSYYAVHTPLTTNPDATQSYTGAISAGHTKFATMVEGVDISLGDILAKLTGLGIAEDTLIFFLGDNGSDSPALTAEGAPSAAFNDYPIRGKKASTYEGGSRVPLIVSWASNDHQNVFQQTLPIAGGSVEHDLVGIEDVMPSILAAADVMAPDVDGYDLSPYLRSESGTHRPQKMLRFMPHEHRSDYFLWYREADWKIVYRFHTEEFELYNLADDPVEADDLASAQPERVLKMARAMAQELDDSWGIYGELWPTHNPTQVAVPDRPLEDDPFLIPFDVDGRNAVDSDGDGLTDELEDMDADGLLDANETDPDNADSDGDGSDDYTEIRLNLDPRNPDERFNAEMELIDPSLLNFTWPSAPGTTFTIQATTNLTTTTSWTVVASNISAHAVSNETSKALLLPNEETEYFRLELQGE